MRPLAYADNLEIDTEEADTEVVMRAAEWCGTFCEELDLTVSAEKSWFWAMSAAARSKLKGCLVQGKPVKVQLACKDLGVQMSYSYQTRTHVQHVRKDEGVRRLKHIAQMPLPPHLRVPYVAASVFSLVFLVPNYPSTRLLS